MSRLCFRKYELYCKPSKVGEGKYSFAETIIDSEKAHEACKTLGLHMMSREKVYALYLDSAMHLIGAVEIASGGIDSAVVDMKVVFGPALVLGKCAGLILAHNHPSGKLSPSNCDVELTKSIRKAGEILGVQLLDHLIVGETGFLSMKSEGMIS